jgi:hypothetical protein
MRPAILIAATAAAALLAASPALAKPAAHPRAAAPAPAAGAADAAPVAAPAGDATTDMRCIVVAGALLGAEDEQVKSVGRASLFYYIGRLQGRGDVANLNARVVGEATRMTSDDIKTQAKTCSAQFTAATQALQDLSDAFQQHFGAPAAGAGAGAGAAPK